MATGHKLKARLNHVAGQTESMRSTHVRAFRSAKESGFVQVASGPEEKLKIVSELSQRPVTRKAENAPVASRPVIVVEMFGLRRRTYGATPALGFDY